MPLLIVYPGFGDSNSEVKQRFVLKLINIVQHDFKIIIFCHGEQKLLLLEKNSNIQIVYEKGIIGQFLYKHITPDLTFFSHIMIVMDDIEVMDDFDINFYITKTKDCDIISPCLTNDSEFTHEYMLQRSGCGLSSVDSMELFMYIMTRDSYIRDYNTFLDKFVSWLWRVDMLFGKKGFKCLLNFNNAVKHHFKGSSRNIQALMEAMHNSKKHIFPARIIQLSHNEATKNLLPLFDYIVLDTDQFVKDEYGYYEQIYPKWKTLPDRDLVAIYMYLYKHGGIWIDNNLAVNNEPLVRKIIHMVETSKRLIINREIIFAMAGDENLYALLLSNNIINSAVGHLEEQILNELTNLK